MKNTNINMSDGNTVDGVDVSELSDIVKEIIKGGTDNPEIDSDNISLSIKPYAYGSVSSSYSPYDNSAKLVSGYDVDSVTISATKKIYNITFEKPRSDTNYSVSITPIESGIPESYYADKIGYTIDYNYSFKKTFSSTVVTDWTIEIRSDRIESLGWQIIAHELGHAIGIQLHTLIDYVNDDVVDLEPDSIMEAIIPLEPILIDYTFMMQKQFEILQAHYGQTEEFPGGICP